MVKKYYTVVVKNYYIVALKNYGRPSDLTPGLLFPCQNKKDYINTEKIYHEKKYMTLHGHRKIKEKLTIIFKKMKNKNKENDKILLYKIPIYRRQPMDNGHIPLYYNNTKHTTHNTPHTPQNTIPRPQ